MMGEFYMRSLQHEGEYNPDVRSMSVDNYSISFPPVKVGIEWKRYTVIKDRENYKLYENGEAKEAKR
jgi:hypothetical protein